LPNPKHSAPARTPARLGLHTCSLGIAKSQAFRTCPHTCSLGIAHLLAWDCQIPSIPHLPAHLLAWDYTPARLGLHTLLAWDCQIPSISAGFSNPAGAGSGRFPVPVQFPIFDNNLIFSVNFGYKSKAASICSISKQLT